MTDKFGDHAESLSSPPSHIIAITPDDGNDLAYCTRGINVATSGEVTVTSVGGETVTLSVAAGIVFPIRACRIWQTGTTASGIVAMY